MKDLLRQGFIGLQLAAWHAPYLNVHKDVDLRVCIGYKGAELCFAKYCKLPCFADLSNNLFGAKVLSSLEPTSGRSQLTCPSCRCPSMAFDATGMHRTAWPCGLASAPSVVHTADTVLVLSHRVHQARLVWNWTIYLCGRQVREGVSNSRSSPRAFAGRFPRNR